MSVTTIALLLFASVFIVAELRKAHVGIVMFAAACGVGLWMADLPLDDVIAGFPIDILILLVGVTYFFGIAKSNGTIGRLVDAALVRVGDNVVALPAVFFTLTAAISAMGSPLGGLVIAPIAMPVAARRGIDPMLMGLAVGTGLSAGAFAPTSLFGIVTKGTADSAGIELNALTLFGAAVVVNLLLLAAAYVMFGGLALRRATSPALVAAHAGGGSTSTGSAGSSGTSGSADTTPSRFEPIHLLTIAFMIGLFATVIGLALADRDPDIGVVAFAFAAGLTLIDPRGGTAAMREIDWSTVLLVGGIITYVGVLESMGAVDSLGDVAASMATPLLAALVLCAVGGLVSAFASTTGILAALVPLALPLIDGGGVSGWGLICALGICSSIVDVSPFSTVGATIVSTTTDPEQRPRMTRLLTRWGLSMVVIGPLVLVGTFVAPGVMF